MIGTPTGKRKNRDQARYHDRRRQALGQNCRAHRSHCGGKSKSRQWHGYSGFTYAAASAKSADERNNLSALRRYGQSDRQAPPKSLSETLPRVFGIWEGSPMSREEAPRHGHAPIPMRAAKDDFDDINALGDFFINEAGDRIYMAIPTTRPFLDKERADPPWTFISLPIGRTKPAQSPSWQWDGNREKPTLSPSVHTFGHWHGWVRNGEMVEA